MHHGLPHIFRAGLALAMTQGDRMRRAIVLHDQRIIHRKIRRSLVELPYRISPCLHDVSDQAVSYGHRSSWIIHKARLYLVPAHGKIRSVSRRKWMNSEFLSPFLTELQHPLGLPRVALLFQDAVVLGTEALL